MVYDVHQYYQRKWLRVLYFREFTDSEAIRLWDSIFAYFFDRGTVDILDYIAIAMLESVKEYILQQIDVSGVLQRLLKFNGSDAGYMIRRAKELEGKIFLMIEAYNQIEKESPNRLISGPAPPMINPKTGPSRYLKDSSENQTTNKDNLEFPIKVKDENLEKLGKLEEKLSESLKKTITQIDEQPAITETQKSDGNQSNSNKIAKIEPEIQENTVQPAKIVTDESLQRKKPPQRKVSDDNLGDYKQTTSEKVKKEEIEEDNEEQLEEQKEVTEIPLKTITSKDDNIFSGLIKKPTTNHETREITVSSEELSKINAKIYSCISELQLECMRNKSTRVQNSIKTLEGIRENLFSILSVKK